MNSTFPVITMDARRQHVRSLLEEMTILPEQYSLDTTESVALFIEERNRKYRQILQYLVENWNKPRLTKEVTRQGHQYFNQKPYTLAKNNFSMALDMLDQTNDNWYPMVTLALVLSLGDRGVSGDAAHFPSYGREFDKFYRKFGAIAVRALALETRRT